MKNIKLTSQTLVGILVAGIMSTLIGSWNYQRSQSRMIETSLATNGLVTCMNRMAQTNTSWTLRNAGSEYLAEDFFKLTNNCLADVNTTLEDKIAASKIILENMNRLMTDAHWFQEKIETSINRNNTRIDTTEVLTTQIQDRFSSIENRMNNIWDQFDIMSSDLNAARAMWLNITLASSFVVMLILAFAIATEYKIQKAHQTLNIQAQNMLAEVRKGLNQEMIEAINTLMIKSLDQAKLNNVAQLYAANSLVLQNTNLNQKTASTAASTATATATTEATASDTSLTTTTEAEIISQIQSTPAVETLQLTLGAIVDKVYENLSARIFGSGVILDLQCEDDVTIENQAEDIEQVIHNLLSLTIDKAELTGPKKGVVKIKAQKGVLTINSSIEAHCFNSDELEFFTNNTGTKKITNINLAILGEVIAQTSNSTVNIKNEFADNDASAIIEITMAGMIGEQTTAETLTTRHTEQTAGRKLAQLTVMSKKELMEKIIRDGKNRQLEA